MEHETLQVYRVRVGEYEDVFYSRKFDEILRFCCENHELLKFEILKHIKIIKDETKNTGNCGTCDLDVRQGRGNYLFLEIHCGL